MPQSVSPAWGRSLRGADERGRPSNDRLVCTRREVRIAAALSRETLGPVRDHGLHACYGRRPPHHQRRQRPRDPPGRIRSRLRPRGPPFPRSRTPEKPEIDWIERITLSFGLSIAVVPFLGLVLNFTPFGIRFAPIVVTISLFTVDVRYAAYWRRMRLPSDKRLSATLGLAMPAWKEYSLLDKGLTIGLAARIVVAGGTLAYVVLMPQPDETFAAFYILGPRCNTSRYPTNLTVNHTGTVILGISNREGANVSYAVRGDCASVQMVYTPSAGLTESVEVNRTTRTRTTTAAGDGASWTQLYICPIVTVGLRTAQFLAFERGDFYFPYREAHLCFQASGAQFNEIGQDAVLNRPSP